MKIDLHRGTFWGYICVIVVLEKLSGFFQNLGLMLTVPVGKTVTMVNMRPV